MHGEGALEEHSLAAEVICVCVIDAARKSPALYLTLHKGVIPK